VFLVEALDPALDTGGQISKNRAHFGLDVLPKAIFFLIERVEAFRQQPLAVLQLFNFPEDADPFDTGGTFTAQLQYGGPIRHLTEPQNHRIAASQPSHKSSRSRAVAVSDKCCED
jgi:hypothetical protein